MSTLTHLEAHKGVFGAPQRPCSSFDVIFRLVKSHLKSSRDCRVCVYLSVWGCVFGNLKPLDNRVMVIVYHNGMFGFLLALLFYRYQGRRIEEKQFIQEKGWWLVLNYIDYKHILICKLRRFKLTLLFMGSVVSLVFCFFLHGTKTLHSPQHPITLFQKLELSQDISSVKLLTSPSDFGVTRGYGRLISSYLRVG